MNRIPMTPQGAVKLQKELEQLKTVDRPAVINAIAEARAHGDLKENAEYHAAKEQQALLETRIADLESKMTLIQVIDVSTIPNEGKVIFGATVKVFNVDNEKDETYQIVGEEEANMERNKISVTSPVARGLIGKFEGDEVTICTPNGDVIFEIVSVDYINQ